MKVILTNHKTQRNHSWTH